MAFNIGPKIGIDGEAEYRKKINNIITQAKTLSSEMKKLSSSFDENGKTVKQNAEQHKLLQAQIQNQESRVKELNAMLDKSKEKYGENATETQKWQQAVNNAETELNELKTQLDKLPSSLDIVAAKFETMGEKMESIGSAMTSIGTKLTSTVTTGIVGAFTAAVKTTGDFDEAMSQVQAVSGATASDLELLRAKAKEMGETTKFSASESAEALNYMAMAGWKTDDMLNGLEGIMNLAAASGEELGTTSDIVTDALTAFGMGADESAHFADILAAAASNSNTNVSMMGESFKYAAPVAGALGYSAEDVAVALGLMANSGIKADQAGTSLRNMFNRMAKPTKESAAAMERLGIELYDGEGEMFTFREIMDQLRASMSEINMPLEDYNAALDELDEQLADGTLTQKKYDEALEELNLQAFGAEGAEKARAAAMLGGTRAMSGLLAISNATEEDYEKLTSAIDNSSQSFAKLADGSVVPLSQALADGSEIIETYNGSAEAMANTMLDNLPGQLTILKSQIEGIAISFGEILMPKVREVVSKMQELADKIKQLSPEQKEQIVKIAAIAAAIGPLLLAGGKLISGLGKIMTFAPKIATALQGASTLFGGFSTTLAGTLAPIAGIAAGIGVLVAAFMTLWNTNEGFRESMTGIWDGIKEKFSGFIDGVQERLPALQEAFTNIVNTIQPLWEGFCAILAPAFEGAFSLISTIISIVLDVVLGILDVFIGVFTGDWDKAKEGALSILNALFTGISSIFTTLQTYLLNTLNVILGFFGTSFEGIKNTVTTAFTNIVTTVTNKITSVKTAVQNGMNAVTSFLSTLPSKFQTYASNMIQNMISAVSSKITTVKTTIQNGMNSAINYLQSLPSQFYSWGSDMINNLVSGITSKISSVTSAVSNIGSTIASFLHFSEPDVGPLSNFNSWMPDMMNQMAAQIEAGRSRVQKAVGNVAADIAMPMEGSINQNTLNYGGTTINLFASDGQDIDELAYRIQEIINNDIEQKEGAFA